MPYFHNLTSSRKTFNGVTIEPHEVKFIPTNVTNPGMVLLSLDDVKELIGEPEKPKVQKKPKKQNNLTTNRKNVSRKRNQKKPIVDQKSKVEEPKPEDKKTDNKDEKELNTIWYFRQV